MRQGVGDDKIPLAGANRPRNSETNRQKNHDKNRGTNPCRKEWDRQTR
jgi:hypothetical protein